VSEAHLFTPIIEWQTIAGKIPPNAVPMLRTPLVRNVPGNHPIANSVKSVLDLRPLVILGTSSSKADGRGGQLAM